jgi:hypothetical protein
MNWYKLFYWLTVADNAKTMFIAFIVIFTIISLIATIAYFSNTGSSYNPQGDSEKENQMMSRKWMWWSYPFMILFWSLYVFTPDRKDALLIVAGGGTMEFLTTDSTAKQIPHELSSFVVTQLKNMGKEAQVELGIQSQKDRILDEAKNMTSQQLLEKMKIDTNFANIILNK